MIFALLFLTPKGDGTLATVLMEWELGSGLGHVAPLLAIARRLRERGHRWVLARSDVVGPAALLGRDGGLDRAVERRLSLIGG